MMNFGKVHSFYRRNTENGIHHNRKGNSDRLFLDSGDIRGVLCHHDRKGEIMAQEIKSFIRAEERSALTLLIVRLSRHFGISEAEAIKHIRNYILSQ